ncbi:MAG: hypothetical protein ACK5MZ_07865 [Aestuariibaculum sp.]
MPIFKIQNLLVFCLLFLTSQAQQIETNGIINFNEEIKRVKLIDWSPFKSHSKKSEQRLLLGKVLLNSNKFALTNWWIQRGFSNTLSTEYLDLKGTTEHFIRPVAAEAEALATSLKTGLYNETITGVPTLEAKTKTIQMIRSLVNAHLATTKNGWGRQWQSALWASYTAAAGWIMWDKLDKTTKKELLAMVYNECDWIMSNKGLAQIKLYRDLQGNITSAGDTGSEENAWDGSILSVALAMMPEHPNFNLWMNKLLFLSLHALSCPSDTKSNTKYNGKKLKDWLLGSNINEDGTIVNHHFIHPDYMTSPFEFNPSKYFLLAKLKIPKAFTLNVERVFYAFANLPFRVGDSITGGVVQQPGGCIFKPNSGDIYYPLGTDWGKWRRMNFAMFNTVTAFLTKNTGIQKRALDWVTLQTRVALGMQNRFDDGHTYLGKSEDGFPSREEWVAHKATTSYIIETFRLLGHTSFTNKKY